MQTKLRTLSKKKLVGLVGLIYFLASMLFATRHLSAQSLPTIRVNAGGGAYTDSQGREWAADNYYNTGFPSSTTTAIAGTEDDPLYQSERWDWPDATPLQYSFPVSNGGYKVRLHFAETYWATSQPGARVFDVDIEGSTVLNDFDIYAEAGANTAHTKEFTTNVSDGNLAINFSHGPANNPKISAIEILPQEALPVEHVSGTLSGNQIWTNDKVWYIDSPITISNTGNLIINPGTIVKFSGLGSGITVSSGGELTANGSSSEPVIFTGHKDDSQGGDSNGDGPSQGANPEYFTGITVSGGTAAIHHITMRHGLTSMSLTSGSVAVGNSILEDPTQISCPGGSDIVLTDNTFTEQVSITECQQDTGTLERNHFVVADNYPISISNSDTNILQLTGPNKNTFTGSGRSVALNLGSSYVPANSSWTFSKESGLQVLYMTGSLQVNGVLNLGAGVSIKRGDGPIPGLIVKSGGTLNGSGTSIDPIVFTGHKDDSVGGDSNGDGSSQGENPEYVVAITIEGGGAALVDHATIRNALTAISVSGQANFSNTNISSVAVGLDVGDSGQVVYRGGFNNVSNSAIRACNWDKNCGVDATHIDWGSADGPFATGVTNRVCGAVAVSPWLYNGATHDEYLFTVKNCDSSSTPADNLSASASTFHQAVVNKQTDCNNGFEDACQAIQIAYQCLGAARELAGSQIPWALPNASTQEQVQTFAGLTVDSASTYLTSQATAQVSGFGVGFFGHMTGAVSTILALSSAFNQCAP